METNPPMALNNMDFSQLRPKGQEIGRGLRQRPAKGPTTYDYVRFLDLGIGIKQGQLSMFTGAGSTGKSYMASTWLNILKNRYENQDLTKVFLKLIYEKSDFTTTIKPHKIVVMIDRDTKISRASLEFVWSKLDEWCSEMLGPAKNDKSARWLRRMNSLTYTFAHKSDAVAFKLMFDQSSIK